MTDLIVQELQQRRQEMIEFLADLVRAESPTSDPSAQQAPQRHLREALAALDYETEHLPGRRSGGVLLARPPEVDLQQPLQLLLGHCDTVWPVGTLGIMPLVVDDKQMRGPGVFDMKAGLTQIIFALRVLHERGERPQVAPVILVNSDEEIGSDESRDHIEKLAGFADRVFVLEPSLGPEGRLKTARKGVGRYRITAQGVAAHAGLDPEKGRSAILAMAHAVLDLFAMNDLARGVSVNVGIVEGGTRANVVAAACWVDIDVRGLRLSDMERIDRKIFSLESAVDGVTLQIEGGINRPPLEKTAGNRQLWRLARKIGGRLGLDLQEGTAGGGSDGNLTSPLAPTLDGLGAAGDGAHASHEFIYIDSLVERTALLAHLLLAPPLAEMAGKAE